MKNRNLKKEIKNDIDFLSEMEETADKAMNHTGKYAEQSDLGAANHLMTLIRDCRKELEDMHKAK